jgi:hypothetical protein
MSLLDKVKETAQKGADKAKEVSKAGQDKIETVKVERHIKELKEELGGLVYGQKTGNPAENADAEIERVVGEIKEAEATLAASDDGQGSDEGTAAAGGEPSSNETAAG